MTLRILDIIDQGKRCKKLMRCVILEALEEVKNKEAYDWLAKKGSGFEEVCDMADWNSVDLQKKIKYQFKVPKKAPNKLPPLTWKGQTMECNEWAKKMGLSPTRLRERYAKYLQAPNRITLDMVFKKERMCSARLIRLDAIKITHKGKTQTLREWQKECKVTESCILNRYKRWKAGNIDTAKFLYAGFLPKWTRLQKKEIKNGV